MPTDQRETQAAVCHQCQHFEQGDVYDAEDVLARKILHYPISAEDVRVQSMALIHQAAGQWAAPRFVVHVEKGRSMVRLSVTGG